MTEQTAARLSVENHIAIFDDHRGSLPDRIFEIAEQIAGKSPLMIQGDKNTDPGDHNLADNPDCVVA